MRRCAAVGVFLWAIAAVGPGVRVSWAQDAGKPADGYIPVQLTAGEVFDVCKSGQIVCPARVPICDDPKVATPVDLPGGLGFKAVSPGTTLCSAASAVGPRRIFRITVR